MKEVCVWVGGGMVVLGYLQDRRDMARIHITSTTPSKII